MFSHMCFSIWVAVLMFFCSHSIPWISPQWFAHRIHPDIRELCDQFYVEERHVEKLNELMKARSNRWMIPWCLVFGGGGWQSKRLMNKNVIGFLVDFHSMITWMVKVGGALLRHCFVIVDILFIYLYLFIYIYIFIFISCKYTSLHLPAPPQKKKHCFTCCCSFGWMHPSKATAVLKTEDEHLWAHGRVQRIAMNNHIRFKRR